MSKVPFRPITDPLAVDLAEVMAPIFGRSPQSILEEAALNRQRRQQKIVNNNERYDRAHGSLNPNQLKKVQELEAQGYETGRLWLHRETGHVAVTMQKNAVWDSRRGRIGRKLIIVYPDCTISETFERSLSVKEEF